MGFLSQRCEPYASRTESVVIGDLNIMGVAGDLKCIGAGWNGRMRSPCEANPVLRIDPDAVLPASIAMQRFEPVRWWGTKIPGHDSCLKFGKRFRRGIGKSLKSRHTLAGQKPFCPSILAAPNCHAGLSWAWYMVYTT
jgi:hypothetical protein